MFKASLLFSLATVSLVTLAQAEEGTDMIGAGTLIRTLQPIQLDQDQVAYFANGHQVNQDEAIKSSEHCELSLFLAPYSRRSEITIAPKTLKVEYVSQSDFSYAVLTGAKAQLKLSCAIKVQLYVHNVAASIITKAMGSLIEMTVVEDPNAARRIEINFTDPKAEHADGI